MNIVVLCPPNQIHINSHSRTHLHRWNYPIISRNYHDFIEHHVDQSDECFENNTNGSVLYSLLVWWLDQIESVNTKNLLSETLHNHLKHCTQQVWLPDSKSDELIWIGNTEHGVAIPDLNLCTELPTYREMLSKACYDYSDIEIMSVFCSGLWPIILLACRHYTMPVHPQLWF